MSIILGIFLGIIFFTVQSVMCIKASSFIMKLIPVFIIVFCLVLSIGLENVLATVVSATVTVICAVGDGMAWLVYYLIMKRK